MLIKVCIVITFVQIFGGQVKQLIDLQLTSQVNPKNSILFIMKGSNVDFCLYCT